MFAVAAVATPSQIAALATLAVAVVGAVVGGALSRAPKHAPGEAERQEAARQDAAHEAELQSIRQEMEEKKNAHASRMASLQVKAATDKQQQQKELNQLQQQSDRIAAAQAENRRRAEAQQRQIAEQWPKPEWLDTGGSLNFGVVGSSGVGKSSLINALLGLRPTDPGAARVGVTETTSRPTPYEASLGSLGTMKLWDLPGAGTELFPRDSYIQRMGLRYFDGLLVVSATRFTEIDQMLFQEARAWKIPSYLVRTKGDVDLESGQDDYGRNPEVTAQELIGDLQSRLQQMSGSAEVNRIFLTTSRSNKFPAILGTNLQRLFRMMADDVRVQRQPVS